MFGSCSSHPEFTKRSGTWNDGTFTQLHNAINFAEDWHPSALSLMFTDCKALKNLSPLSQWSTDSLTNTSEMFKGCSNLVTLTGLNNWNVSKVNNTSSMFLMCKSISNVDELSGWKTGILLI